MGRMMAGQVPVEKRKKLESPAVGQFEIKLALAAGQAADVSLIAFIHLFYPGLRLDKADSRILLPVEFDSGNLLVWVFSQDFSLRRQLNTLLLEKRIQLAIQAPQIKSLLGRGRSKSPPHPERNNFGEDDKDDRDNRVIPRFKHGEQWYHNGDVMPPDN
jgi:hypothetical protein